MQGFSCRKCGFRGAPEDVLRDFAVCPECGGVVGGEAGLAPPFDRSVYRYGARLAGMGVLLAKLGPKLVRDEADRPIARVHPRRAPLRRLFALAAGSVTFVALTLAYAWLVSQVADGWLLLPLALGVIAILVAALGVVCLLSPGPDALLVAAGHDPRLLVRVRPTHDGWARSTLAVEDGDGTELGTLVLDRFRNVIYPLGALGPVAELHPAGGPRLLVTRQGAWTPGLVLAGEDGEVVATYGCNPGLLGPDELSVIDPPPCDRRLFVAALMVLRP